jgi:hypothetical protein
MESESVLFRIAVRGLAATPIEYPSAWTRARSVRRKMWRRFSKAGHATGGDHCHSRGGQHSVDLNWTDQAVLLVRIRAAGGQLRVRIEEALLLKPIAILLACIITSTKPAMVEHHPISAALTDGDARRLHTPSAPEEGEP